MELEPDSCTIICVFRRAYVRVTLLSPEMAFKQMFEGIPRLLLDMVCDIHKSYVDVRDSI